MSPKLAVDRTRCGATGNCVFWAPNTFELGDDGIATVINHAGDAPGLIEQAVANCPLLAISLALDANTGGNGAER